MVEQYDLEEQQEDEQFTIDEEDGPSSEVKQRLRELKLYEKQKKKEESKHRATFTRIDNQNGYICDRCGQPYIQEHGSLIYSNKGEFAYCKECLKVLYPNYRHIKLAGTVNKLDYRSNHCDTQYFSRIK